MYWKCYSIFLFTYAVYNFYQFPITCIDLVLINQKSFYMVIIVHWLIIGKSLKLEETVSIWGHEISKQIQRGFDCIFFSYLNRVLKKGSSWVWLNCTWEWPEILTRVYGFEAEAGKIVEKLNNFSRLSFESLYTGQNFGSLSSMI